MPKFVSQIRLDESVYEKVKYIAIMEFRSMNAQMEYFIVNGIAQYETEHNISLVPQPDGSYTAKSAE
ncbi:MAG: hypothetical protein LBK04_05040 [Clostridiales Family XIII bacterium]|jgi:hypothetical protein|nr:hypothetical protein [Clostridiales Family XIII bacterium]